LLFSHNLKKNEKDIGFRSFKDRVA